MKALKIAGKIIVAIPLVILATILILCGADDREPGDAPRRQAQ